LLLEVNKKMKKKSWLKKYCYKHNKMTVYESTKFNTFIYKVLKQVHPDIGMTGDSVVAFDSMIRIVMRKLMHAVNILKLGTRSKTISSRDIQSAVRLVFPGEIAKHAVSEGTKAVTKYNASKEHKKEKKKDKYGNTIRTMPVSKTFRSGLVLPVTRVEHIMMEFSVIERKSSTAAIYLAAVLEYIVAEILELSGNATRDYKRARIKPRFITLAINGDEELSKLFHNSIFSGGVTPNMT